MRKYLGRLPLQIGAAALLVVALLFAALGAAPAIQAQGEPTGVVAVGALNLRAGPGLAYRVLDALPRNAQVDLLGRNIDATWVEVNQEGGPNGWMYAPYLETNVAVSSLPQHDAAGGPGQALAVVATGLLNVRSGPGPEYAVLDTISRYETVSLLGRNSDGTWVQVNSQLGPSGWMYAPYLETSASIAALPVTTASGGPGINLPDPDVVAYPLYTVIQNDIADVYLQDFPIHTSVTVTLARTDGTGAVTVGQGLTDAEGKAQFTFTMPNRWSDGGLLVENQLLVTASTANGNFSQNAVIDYFRFGG